jgi:hypothetical protein
MQVDAVREAQADPNYKLPIEFEEAMERDPVHRSLDDLKMSLERAREVAAKEKGAEHADVKKIAAELEATARQLTERTVKLTARAKEQSLNSVTSALGLTDARILNIKKKHDEKQAEIRRLDHDLVAYRALDEVVAAARQEFNRAQTAYNQQDGIIRTRQSRIQFASRARPVAP